jgi:hypothetical protein
MPHYPLRELAKQQQLWFVQQTHGLCAVAMQLNCRPFM